MLVGNVFVLSPQITFFVVQDQFLGDRVLEGVVFSKGKHLPYENFIFASDGDPPNCHTYHQNLVLNGTSHYSPRKRPRAPILAQFEFSKRLTLWVEISDGFIGALWENLAGFYSAFMRCS